MLPTLLISAALKAPRSVAASIRFLSDAISARVSDAFSMQIFNTKQPGGKFLWIILEEILSTALCFCFACGPYSDHGHCTHNLYVKRYCSIKAKILGNRHSHNKLFEPLDPVDYLLNGIHGLCAIPDVLYVLLQYNEQSWAMHTAPQIQTWHRKQTIQTVSRYASQYTIKQSVQHVCAVLSLTVQVVHLFN